MIRNKQTGSCYQYESPSPSAWLIVFMETDHGYGLKLDYQHDINSVDWALILQIKNKTKYTLNLLIIPLSGLIQQMTNWGFFFFFLFFPENRILYFMQSVSFGDNLHEISNPVFWEKKKNMYFKMLSDENFTQHAKC